jgi:hypothetical protein
MRLTCKSILFMNFLVLYSASVLILVVPQMVAAASHLLGGGQLYEFTLVCSEWRRPERVAGPFGPPSSGAGDNVFTPLQTHHPVSRKTSWVELHVPVTLLQALQTMKRGDAVVELQVPAALLTLLHTVDLEELP